MPTSISLPRVSLYCLAILFAAAFTLYSVLWVFHVSRWAPGPGILSYEYSATDRFIRVDEVLPESPAEQAGLRPGDRIVGINGRKLTSLLPFYDAIVVGHVGFVELTVVPVGQYAPRRLQLALRGSESMPKPTTRLQDAFSVPIDYYPFGFLIVGLAVLFLRLDYPNAWRVALLFGSFAAGGPFFESAIPAPWRGFAVFYKITMCWLEPALFYYFFAVFPAPSPIDPIKFTPAPKIVFDFPILQAPSSHFMWAPSGICHLSVRWKSAAR